MNLPQVEYQTLKSETMHILLYYNKYSQYGEKTELNKTIIYVGYPKNAYRHFE